MTGSPRYMSPTGPEAETEPGSRGHVLRNLLGITSKTEMDRVEHDALLLVQAEYQRTIGDRTSFTAETLRRMHRDWLGGIYAWAGRYRTVDLTKEGFRWPPAHMVAENMERFDHERLRTHTPCAPGSLPQVALRIAEVHADLLLIHPFREGNGRLARWLAGLMALQADLPAPAYRFEGRGSRAERARYLAAVKRGYRGDYEDLRDFFVDAVERRLV